MAMVSMVSDAHKRFRLYLNFAVFCMQDLGCNPW